MNAPAFLRRLVCKVYGHDIKWRRDAIKSHRLRGVCLTCGHRTSALDPKVADQVSSSLAETYPNLSRLFEAGRAPDRASNWLSWGLPVNLTKSKGPDVP